MAFNDDGFDLLIQGFGVLPTPKPKPVATPDKQGDRISFYAQKNGVEPAFVRAVVGQESGGDPKAKSWANAKGLLQLTDPIGRKYYGAKYNPFDADQNLDAGTKHLKYLIDKYGGDKKRALAAYNAGEGNANKRNWYARSVFWSNDKRVQKGLKPRGWSDKTNTRFYIDKIYGNYEKLKAVKGQPQISEADAFDSVTNQITDDEIFQNLISEFVPR